MQAKSVFVKQPCVTSWDSKAPCCVLDREGEKEVLPESREDFEVATAPRGGGGVLTYMGYIGMCRCEGYGFKQFTLG